MFQRSEAFASPPPTTIPRGAGRETALRDPFEPCQIVLAPGLHNSGSDHWQSAWQRRFARFHRVEQIDWDRPDLDVWARALVERAITLAGPVVVVAHSFGCLATVRASLFQSGLIAGALLVAPAEPSRFQIEVGLPQSILPYPTTLVASTDDPYMTLASAARWAGLWGSELVTLDAAGHINAQSGFDEWPLGLALLETLCRRVGAASVRALS